MLALFLSIIVGLSIDINNMSTIGLIAQEHEVVSCQGHCLCVEINGCVSESIFSRNLLKASL